MRERKKGCEKEDATMNIITSIFNMQYGSSFYMEFYATDMIEAP